MEKKSLDFFQQSITRHHDELLTWLNSEQQQIQLHTGSASIKDILQTVSNLKEVLEKIDHGNFGECKVCSGDVELERLEIDCTTNICLDCYSEEQIRALERDLELAAKVQKQLLPNFIPSLKGLQIAVHTQSAQVVGGDYYDFFNAREGLQGIAIGDVMGKGLPASMLMSNLQASLRILGSEYDKMNSLAHRLNGLFRYNTKLIRFISLFLATIDIKSGEFAYCNAGHHPPIRWRSKSKEVQLLNPTAPAIGLTAEAEFNSGKIHLESGDLLLLYTDGLIEARNEKGQEFGEERLEELLQTYARRNADTIVAEIWSQIKQFAGKFHDDATIMVLKLM